MVDNDGVLIDDFTIDDIPYNMLKDIFNYWLAIKGGRAMPSRRDLNPADIVTMLPHICLVDVDDRAKRYRIRLVGTETVKALGADITGKYLDQYPGIENHLKVRYDWLVQNKRPYLVSDKLKWSQKSFLNFCSIGLPLSANGRDVNIIMFGSCFHNPVIAGQGSPSDQG
ncbi:MAG: PAS domain-containing protein [Alphaproteobacteria bacterium]|nr:PAS domain-containing protein [Alphaproteobacteria bacterium]